MSRPKHPRPNRYLRAIAALLAAVGLLSACGLCAASVWQRLPVSWGRSVGVAAVDAPAVCHCLHCTMPHGMTPGVHSGMCCCCTGKQSSGICLRASCDTGEAALLRVAWTLPTIPLTRLTLALPAVAPAVLLSAPRRHASLSLRAVAPPFQPPQVSA